MSIFIHSFIQQVFIECQHYALGIVVSCGEEGSHECLHGVSGRVEEIGRKVVCSTCQQNKLPGINVCTPGALASSGENASQTHWLGNTIGIACAEIAGRCHSKELLDSHYICNVEGVDKTDTKVRPEG